MDTAYLQVINGHSIGDTLSLMSFDVMARRRGYLVCWIVHTGHEPRFQPELTQGFYHVELFRLYDRAGLFERRIHLDGVNANNWREVSPATYELYLERVYAIRATIARYSAKLPYGLVTASAASELRQRFAFLGGHDSDPYATIQPTSTHYINDAYVRTMRAKRISVGCAAEHLLRRAAELKRLYVVGSKRDAAINAVFSQRLRERLAGVEVIDYSGRTTLEQCFRILYGSHFHLSAESGTAFFTGQIGVPSVTTFLPESTFALESFRAFFAGVPCLEMVADAESGMESATDLGVKTFGD